MRQALMAKRLVYVRVTADLSVLEETETASARGGGAGGKTHHHPLDEVESVAVLTGTAERWGLQTGGGWGEHIATVAGVQQQQQQQQQPVFVIRIRGKGQVRKVFEK